MPEQNSQSRNGSDPPKRQGSEVATPLDMCGPNAMCVTFSVNANAHSLESRF
jgi:hypothetical protein